MVELREDQKRVAQQLIELLKKNNLVALQAPTGWGKSFTAAWIVKQLSGRWLWGSNLLSSLVTASNALKQFNVKYFVSAGREKLCLRNFSYIDFLLRDPCSYCRYNVPKITGIENLDFKDYTEVRAYVEERDLDICPYTLQENVIRQLMSRSDNIVILMNYARLPKFLRFANAVIIDEAHGVAVPRIVEVPRRVMELLLLKLGLEDVRNNAELARDLLSENILQLAMDDEVSEFLNDVIEYIRAKIVYYDHDREVYVGIQIMDLPNLHGKKVIMMSATLPLSILSSVPTIKVPAQQVIAKIPKNSIPITVKTLQQNSDSIKALLEKYLDGTPTIIFTTNKKDVPLQNAVYEDEVKSLNDICSGKYDVLVLYYFGRFSEGIRLNNCYRRAILYTLPMLPPYAMKRLEDRGISPKDIVILKAIQAMGRVMPNNDVEVIMLDSRFKMYCSDLENYGVKCIED